MNKKTDEHVSWHFGMSREEYEQLIKDVYDSKISILSNFNSLLDYAEAFYHLPEELQKGWALMEKYYKHHMRVFISFCLYRLSDNLEVTNDKITAQIKDFECDCCQGVTEFYKASYTWLDNFVCKPLTPTSEKYLLYHKNTVFKGDTMTSVFTPLKEYFKLESGVQCTSSKTESWEEFWLSNIWETEFGKARNAVSIHFPYFVTEFICACYCCANFLPVPQGFNSGRSNYGRWDSWDLTLNQIYQWYLDNPNLPTACTTNNHALEKLFQYASNQEDAIGNCTEWLKLFGSWKNFVDQNYMQSFLLPDGRPKKFFKNHTLEYGLPKTLDEYEEFFINAVSCIRERGNIMNKSLDTPIYLE